MALDLNKQIAAVDEKIGGAEKLQQQGFQQQAEMVQRQAAERKPVQEAMLKEQGDTAQFIERRAADRPVIPDFKPQPPVDAKEYQGLSYALIGLAMIGGIKSKGNWLGVADTLNGAMKGFIEGNHELAKKNADDYDKQFKAAMAHDQQYQRQTEDILKSRNMSINQKNTQLRILAAEHGDEATLAELRMKSIDGTIKTLSAQKTALTNAQQKHEDTILRLNAEAARRREHDATLKAIAAMRGGGQAASPDQKKQVYELLDPTSQTALDAQSWAYIDRGVLPYRKGSGGGADRNDMVMWNAGRIAQSLGMSGQELAAMPAAYKADAQALAASTKKLDSVQATYESLHNNIQTWEAIRKGEAPKLGGAKLRELGNDLKKINFTDVTTLNDWKLKIGTQFNDPSTVAYVTAAFTVAMDYSRILSSQGQSAAQVTEGARNEALKLIQAGYNDKANKAQIGTLESEAAGIIKGQETQVDRQRSRLGLRGRPSVADSKGGDAPAAPSTGAPAPDAPLSPAEKKELEELRKGTKKTSSADRVIDFNEIKAA